MSCGRFKRDRYVLNDWGSSRRLALAFRRDIGSVTFVVSVDLPCFGMIVSVVHFFKYFGPS